MAIKFYLNNQEINVETNATFTATQDESDDIGSFVLEWNETANAIAPRTQFRIENTTTGEVWRFIVLQDLVEVVKKTNPVKYKHNLTVTQNVHELTHFLLRPSTFQQPLQFKRAKTIAHGYIMVKAERDTSVQTERYNFFTDGNMHLPNHHSPAIEKNIYRKTLLYIDPREKVDVATVDVESWISHFSHITRTLDRFIVGTQHGWAKNTHSQIKIVLGYYGSSSSGSPIATQEYSITGGGRKENATSLNLDTNFFKNNGAGWYGVSLKLENDVAATFGLDRDDIWFTVLNDVDYTVTGVYYPNVLAKIDLELKVHTYYYTLYDILDQIQKQSVKRLSGVNRQKTSFVMPSENSYVPEEAENARVLKSIIAPDFKFNGINIFDAVNQVLSYIDSVATLGIDNVLGFEYLNDFNGEKITNMDQKIADIQTMLNDKYYDNQIVTTYQNGKQENAITYPANGLYKKLESTKYGIPSAEDYVITTDKPIESIENLYIKVPSSFFVLTYFIDYSFHYGQSDIAVEKLEYSSFSMPNQVIDIQECVVEQKVHSTLPVGAAVQTNPTAEQNQNNTIAYEMGSKVIRLGTYDQDGYKSLTLLNVLFKIYQLTWMYVNDIYLSGQTGASYPALYNQYYAIKYKAIFDGQVMVESPNSKEEGNYQVAQSASSVQINKMGSNMLGFIAKAGNESKSITMALTSYGDRLKKGSVWEDDNNVKWIANTVKTTFSVSTDQVINEVEFVKNFNKINNRTQVDQEIRFYEIDQRLTSKGYENVNEFIVLSLSSIKDYDMVKEYTDEFVEAIFRSTLQNNNETLKADYAIVYFDNHSPNYYIPLHVYGAGNVLCFEMGFESPNLAGNRIQTISGNILSTAEIYPDFAEDVSFAIYNLGTPKDAGSYPIWNSSSGDTYVISGIYKYYKRLNEILHLNYGIAFVAKDGDQIYVGEEFIAQNGIIPNNKYLNRDRELHLFVSNEETYGINDRKALGDDQGKVVPTFNATNQRISIQADNHSDFTQAVSWCVADKDRNIYFAVNQDIGVVQTAHPYWSVFIYYATRYKRL